MVEPKKTDILGTHFQEQWFTFRKNRGGEPKTWLVFPVVISLSADVWANWKIDPTGSVLPIELCETSQP